VGSLVSVIGVFYFLLVIFYLFMESDLAISFKDHSRFLYLTSSNWEAGAPSFSYFPSYDFFDTFVPLYYDMVVEGKHHINFYHICCYKHYQHL